MRLNVLAKAEEDAKLAAEVMAAINLYEETGRSPAGYEIVQEVTE
jgi:hypothetical protein